MMETQRSVITDSAHWLELVELVGDVMRIETLKLESQKGVVITVILEGKMEH